MVPEDGQFMLELCSDILCNWNNVLTGIAHLRCNVMSGCTNTFFAVRVPLDNDFVEYDLSEATSNAITTITAIVFLLEVQLEPATRPYYGLTDDKQVCHGSRLSDLTSNTRTWIFRTVMRNIEGIKNNR